jgi:hypothetical protein
MRRYFWVGYGCFSWGDGGGRETTRACSVGSVTGRRTLSNSPIYVIYYMLSSGGFVAACLQSIGKGFLDPWYPGQCTCAVQDFSIFDNPSTCSTHEDSEGAAVPRSVTDSTEQWVWCFMHMWFMLHVYFCYMFCLGSSSGSSDSVRIYRKVILGNQNWRCAWTSCT